MTFQILKRYTVEPSWETVSAQYIRLTLEPWLKGDKEVIDGIMTLLIEGQKYHTGMADYRCVAD